jgi:hypothetical protein
MRRLVVLVVAAGVLIGAIVTARTQGSGNYPVPDSIAADCSVDVAAALNAFIASVPNGGLGPNGPVFREIVFKAGGCYKVTQPLQVPRRAYLRFDGQGATIESDDVDDSGSQPAWRVRFSHDIQFTGFVVNGDYGRPSYYSGPPFEWSHGWEVGGSHDVLIERSEIHNVRGDGVEVSPRWDGSIPVTSWNVTVRDTLVDGSGRMCLSLTGGHDVTWEGNTLRNCPWIFDLELEWADAGFGIEDVAIRGNRTGLYRLVWLANAGQCGTHRSIAVENNLMDRSGPTSWPPISIENPGGCAQRGPYSIGGNTFRMPGGALYGAQVVKGGATDVLIDSNVFVWEQARSDNALAKLENAHLVQINRNVLQGAGVLVKNLGNSDWTAEGNSCGAFLCR